MLARLPEASYSAFEDERYEELDILDRVMPKHSVVPPTERELQAYEILIRDKPPMPESQKLVLCIETEDWKFTNQTCHLSILNMSADMVSYRISRREVLEEQLLPPEYVDRFRFFQSVYDAVAGSAVSQAERERLSIRDQSEFTYGEVDFIGMIPLLEMCAPQPGWTFWDLGCGAGKCLVSVALLYPKMKAITGVELLPALADLCKTTVEHLKPRMPIGKITVIQGDILKVDWSKASLVYMASICFPDELLEAVVTKAKAMKIGSFVLTLKNFPPNDCFEVRRKVRVRMTWGKSAVFLLEKVR